MAAAAVITDAIFEKMVLMLVDTPGRMAPAATATKPAIRAYSIMSWARVSFQIMRFHNSRFKRFIVASRGERSASAVRSSMGKRS